jgi:hypothetical protein
MTYVKLDSICVSEIVFLDAATLIIQGAAGAALQAAR